MDFEQLLIEKGIEYRTVGQHHHCTIGRVNLDCPWCSPNSKSFRLGWHLAKRYFNCWSCGQIPTAKVFAELFDLSMGEAIKLAGNIRPEEDERVVRQRGVLKLPSHVGPLERAHRNYLQGRKLDVSDMTQNWHLQGINHLGGKYSWRIFIPVELNRKVVSWTTRAIGNAPRRYLSAPATDEVYNIKTLLYGMDYCTHRDNVLVVEGPADVWKIGPGTVATFGIDYSTEQVAKLSQFKTIYICYDKAPKAQEQARKLMMELSVFGGMVHNLVLEKSKDPGSAKGEELKALRELVMPF